MKLARLCYFPILCLGPVVLVGCTRGDTDRLAKIGNIVLDRASDSAEEFQKRYISEVPIKDNINNWRLANRVRRRLQTDKLLSELTLEVKATGQFVELHGKVENSQQRQRAVNLAETTVGVETLKDHLLMGGR